MNWGTEWIGGIDWGKEGDERTVITINIPPDHDLIEAIQVGDLAIHDDINDSETSAWVITHVPTLSRFDRALPHTVYAKGSNPLCDNYSKEQLIKWCKLVQDDCLDDWKLLREQWTHKTLTDKVRDAKLRLIQWCRSIEV